MVSVFSIVKVSLSLGCTMLVYESLIDYEVLSTTLYGFFVWWD